MSFRERSKKCVAGIVSAAMLMSAAVLPSAVSASGELRQVEALGRGIVAACSPDGIFLSWRLLGTENYGTTFNVYRNGQLIANVSDSTNYLDTAGSVLSKYTVRSVVNGVEITQSDTVTPWSDNYVDIPLNVPSDTTLDGAAVTYSANDASVADVDGDGEYEIILKWDPSNSHDNADSGRTSNVYIDCYEMDGTQRWRIDLGRNIRAGAHYTQFIAYDFNGDGKAEVAMKTADATVAGDGTVIGDASADYRNSSGYILSGPEYLTMFDGETGSILSTVDYTPARGTVSSWGDKYGNRVDRFLAGVAYLDGKTPYLIEARGYYTRTVISAYTFTSGALTRKWTFDTNSTGNSSYAGQGNHSLSVADVDGDGCDEIIYGSLVVDHNGTALNCTGYGHGDALHVGDFDPTIDGYEIFQVHEDCSASGTQMRKASTGETIWNKAANADIGRGVIANMSAVYPYYIAWSTQGMFDRSGNVIECAGTSNSSPNFAVWWDGDLYRELLDGTKLTKWNDSSNSLDRLVTFENVSANNGTKSNPCLQADIFGDWREEVMYRLYDSSALRIFTSTSVTDTKLYTLMHDTQYRCAVAWQNVGYNQPPHTSYYMGPDMEKPAQPSVYTVGSYSLEAPSDIPGVSRPSIPSDTTTLYSEDFEDGTSSFSLITAAYSANEYLEADTSSVNANSSSYVYGVGARSGDTGAQSANIGTTKNTAYVSMDFKMDACGSGKSSNIALLGDSCGSNWLDSGSQIIDISANAGGNGYWGTISVNGINITDTVNISAGVSNGQSSGKGGLLRDTTGWLNLYAKLNFDSQTADITITRVSSGDVVYSGTVGFVNNVSSLEYIHISAGRTYGGVFVDNVIAAEEVPMVEYTEDFEDGMSDFSLITSGYSDHEYLEPDTSEVNRNTSSYIYGVGSRGGDTGSQSIDLGVNASTARVSIDVKMDACQGGKSSSLSFIGGRNTANWLSSGSQIVTLSASAGGNGYWSTIKINGVDITSAANVANGTSNGESSGKGGLHRDTTGWLRLYADLDFASQTADVKLMRLSTGAAIYSGTVDFVNNVSALDHVYIAAGKAYGGVFIDNLSVKYPYTENSGTNTYGNDDIA